MTKRPTEHAKGRAVRCAVVVAGLVCSASALATHRYELLGMVGFVLVATFAWRPRYLQLLGGARRDPEHRPLGPVDGLLLWLAIGLVPTALALLRDW